MAYVPDPTNVNEPTDSTKAGTADDEFRALKAYIQGLVLGAVSQGPTVRQTALIGSQDANGDPNFLAAGTGLAVDVDGLAAPLALTYAAGSGAAGDINYSEAINEDVVDAVTGLAPSNLSYITKIFNGAWGKTLAPVQYGKVFDKTAQLLIRWPGINNATVTTEDFGNVATFAGNAKLSTAVQILGLNTVALDGTTDLVHIPFTTVGSGSWEIITSFRTSSLAAQQMLLNVGRSNTVGLQLIITTGGKITTYLSSTGGSNDIINGTAGATTLVINTTYYLRFVFDAVAGTYQIYLSNNGAAEVQDFTFSSTLRMCSVAAFTIGAGVDASIGFNGNIGFTGFRRFASFTSAQATGPTVAPTFADVKSDFFSIPQMKMYEITAESTVAGTDPAMTAVNKLYVGETVTGVSSVTSVVSYAFKGRYESEWFAVVASTQYPKSHNLGVIPQQVQPLVADSITGQNPRLVAPYYNGAAAFGANQIGAITRLSISYATLTNIAFSVAGSTQTTGFYKYSVNRGW